MAPSPKTEPHKEIYRPKPDPDDPLCSSKMSDVDCCKDDELTPEELVAMASQGSRAISLVPQQNGKHATSVNSAATPIGAKSSNDENGNDDAAAAATMPALQRERRFVSPGAFPSGGSDDEQDVLNTAVPIEAVLVQENGSIAAETVNEEDNDSEMVTASRVEVSAITKAEPTWPLQKWARYGMASLCLLTISVGLILVLVLVMQANRSEDESAEESIATMRPVRPNVQKFYTHHAAVLATQLNDTENCLQAPNSTTAEPLEFVLSCHHSFATIIVHTWDEETVTLDEAPPSSDVPLMLNESGNVLRSRRTAYLKPNSIGFVAFNCEFQLPIPPLGFVKEVAENEAVTQSPVGVRFQGQEEGCSEGGAFIRLLRHCGMPLDEQVVSCTGEEHKGFCVQTSDSCEAGAASCSIPAFTSIDSSWCPAAVSSETPDSFVERHIIGKMDDFRLTFSEVLG